jgi:RND superfamily putative drug exporter
VLFVAFGSLLAAALPIVVAAAALGLGVAAVMLLSNVMSIPTESVTIGVLLGLGVGIDYALFIVSRFRTALRAGRSVPEAVVESVDSSGRAVVFAGSTVIVSILGLVLIGLSFLTGIGVAVAVTVLFTVVAAVTLLPAVLAIVGVRVLSRKVRREIAAPASQSPVEASERSSWWVRLVTRRPVAAVAVGGLAMLALSVPVADLRLGTADQGSDPRGSVTRVGYDLLAEGFGPGVNGPLLVAAATPDEPAREAARRLSQDLGVLDGVASVTPAQTSADGSAALIQVLPTTAPQAEETERLIDRIRADVVRSAEARTPGLDVHVGGPTAMFDDFATTVTDALPLFFVAIIGLSFLLLVLAFRSLLVPALGAVMNVLGAAAAFGVMVAMFQWGWGAELVDVDKAGPIEPFIPVIAFAILFGLSMDYQVFLVSRVHEEWVATRDNRRAVTVGLQQTRPVITAAALIMVFVFSAFVAGDSRIIKLVGSGLAIGVALDAFVLRQTLAPGALLLGGRANWWLPRWLDRLVPHVSVEGSAEDPGAQAKVGSARSTAPA